MRQKVCAELIIRIQNNDKSAESELIIECLPNITKFCKKFEDEYNALYSYDDAVQDCSIATLYAATKYDKTQLGNFFNYVTFYWYQAVLRNRGDMLPVHLPVDVENRYRKNNPDILDTLKDTATLSSLYSIEDAAGKQDRIYIYDIIEDDNVESTAALLDSELLKQYLHNYLDTLTDRCKTVIIHRFGLDGNNPMTYDEVGKIMGVTRERIRQIEAKSLRMLAHRCKELRCFL